MAMNTFQKGDSQLYFHFFHVHILYRNKYFESYKWSKIDKERKKTKFVKPVLTPFLLGSGKTRNRYYNGYVGPYSCKQSKKEAYKKNK